MERNNKSNLTVQNIVSLFSIIIGTNYFLSYRWFDGFLRINGIDSLAIMTLDDLTFLFAKYNIQIFKMTSIGFIGIFFADILESSFNYNIIKNIIDYVIEKFKKKQNDFRKKKLIKAILILSTTLIVILIIYFCLYKSIVEFPSPILLIIYLLILATPLLYHFKANMRRLIFIAQILLMFIWANLFIDYVLEESSKSKVDKLIAISFDYDNKKVETNDTLSFVFQSYKYTILKGSVSYFFYNNSDIKNLKYTETSANVKHQSVSTHKEKI